MTKMTKKQITKPVLEAVATEFNSVILDEESAIQMGKDIVKDDLQADVIEVAGIIEASDIPNLSETTLEVLSVLGVELPLATETEPAPEEAEETVEQTVEEVIEKPVEKKTIDKSKSPQGRLLSGRYGQLDLMLAEGARMDDMIEMLKTKFDVDGIKKAQGTIKGHIRTCNQKMQIVTEKDGVLKFETT